MADFTRGRKTLPCSFLISNDAVVTAPPMSRKTSEHGAPKPEHPKAELLPAAVFLVLLHDVVVGHAGDVVADDAR